MLPHLMLRDTLVDPHPCTSHSGESLQEENLTRHVTLGYGVRQSAALLAVLFLDHVSHPRLPGCRGVPGPKLFNLVELNSVQRVKLQTLPS